MKRLSVIAAALLLGAAGSAAAQGKPPATAPQQQDEGEPDDAEVLAMLQAAVADMRRSMFAPGPAVEGWNRGGADPDAELRARGADRNVFLLRSASEPSVVMLTERPIADFAPSGWRIVDSYGSATERVRAPFVQFTRLTPRYVIAMRAGSQRVGTADCTDPIAHAMLYEVPDAPESEDDETLPLFFRIALLAGEGQIVCTRYVRDGEGWRLNAFLPDGRSLPQLDRADDRLSIVPVGPVDALLRLAHIAGTPS